MNNYFERARLYEADCFVADYTLQTKNQRGVELSETPFTDIAFFHLANPAAIAYWGVNFEEHAAFFKDPVTHKTLSQCECMFVSHHANRKAWVCLVEMKYCLENNIKSNAYKAYGQLQDTLTYLKANGVLNDEKHRFYLNYSVPDYSNREPFTSFLFTPEDLLEYKRKGISLLGYNNVLVLNEEYVNLPKINIP